jgi:hypothetical protein
MMKHDWPTREQWAEQRRTVYFDMENPNPADSLYASDSETAQAIAAVKECRLNFIQAQRERERALGPLGRQRGESESAYNKRSRAFSKEQIQTFVNTPSSSPYSLRELNEVLKQLEAGTVPWRWVFGPARKPLDAILARYKAACGAAQAAWEQEVAQTPVDDAAWEQELARRRQFETEGPIRISDAAR